LEEKTDPGSSVSSTQSCVESYTGYVQISIAMSSLSTVVGIKKSLSKMLPVDDVEADQVEQCKDLLKQLDDVDISLDILSKSLIGTIVSKFKHHEELGPPAKALVKKWKLVAKGGGVGDKKPVAKQAAKAKAERRDSTISTGSASATAEDEWAGLQPHRQHICKKLHEIMLGVKGDLVKDGINASAVDHLVVQRATEVEASIQQHMGNDKSSYSAKARSLCFNIKNNKKMGGEVILGQVSADDLVNMSTEELASDDKRKEREERRQHVMDTTRLDWERENESKINDMCGITGDLLKASLFTCGRCKSIKTTSTQKQTRSADEPMTVFVLCLNCGKRWKC
jgi:transcription elongation factor S-II